MQATSIDDLVESIRQADRTRARVLVEAWAAEKGYESVVLDLLSPALESIGKGWSEGTGEVSLAQAYVASKLAEEVLGKVLAQRAGSGVVASTKGPVVVGNIQDDFHPLGRKMVASFLRLEGWDVRDLGVDVSAKDFVDTAQRVGARVLGVSAMMYSTAKNVVDLRREIDTRGLHGQLQLAVGGAVFKLRPELLQAFGADGTAATALDAPALFETLWQRSRAFQAGLQGGGVPS
jgi:methanogenic corrinoid protein MtbC1